MPDSYVSGGSRNNSTHAWSALLGRKSAAVEALNAGLAFLRAAEVAGFNLGHRCDFVGALRNDLQEEIDSIETDARAHHVDAPRIDTTELEAAAAKLNAEWAKANPDTPGLRAYINGAGL